MELISDNPIKDSSNDLLDRASSAEAFAKHIFSFDYKEGLVVGLCGEWGNGKTSYINLMRPELEKNSFVLDFNPWMFSDAHNLVALFFTEISAQLRDYEDDNELINSLSSFGELLSNLKPIPFVGNYFSVLGGCLGFFSKKKKEKNSLKNQRDKLIKVLKEISKPITVILDDIDRLSSDELQSILKLVRVTGNFPNIVYVLSFDKNRVIKTLNDNNIDGRDYLEKIIQIPFDIPQVPKKLLQENLFSSLDKILGDVYLDKVRWSNAYWNIIKPTIKNIRDIRRYTSSLSNIFKQLGAEIDVVDLLTIEAIRIFYPNKFKEIFELKDYILVRSNDDKRKDKLKNFIQDNEMYDYFLEILFDIDNINSNNEFLKNRRIAYSAFFDLYFEQVMSPEFINVKLSQKVWLAMQSEEDFKIALSAVPDDSLENVVNNLIDYEKDFTKEIALATIPTLYRNLPRVPEKELGFFDFGADMIWRNLVYRLLINIPDGDKIETITQLFDSCDLYGKFDIIKIVGHSHNLASKTEEEKLEEIFLSDISVATIKELSESYNLSRILYFSFLKGKRISNDRLSSHEVLLSLLKSSISEVKSQRGSDPTIYREKTLHWDNLVKIYGDETKLVKLIEEIANNQEIIEKDYVKLAIKYKDGYRNKESIDNDDELD
ncbi:P-loop domain protein, KAP family [Aggregatibacter sp. oral taxon 458 str. W10330]|uniref:KAP family P-loop NTPase fold protein n=1 Tax=Aggregatibacter sp. oral taxon 458 TaxID=712148 RepID=UPI00039770FA|nr:P-loop NTPase fold protein [Aggregatibacter sp. oral taxon 458]ERH27425.1 P-loop domain protein, KAP family [Aggregatibacter sp. oral taxon 458 str. W10330]